VANNDNFGGPGGAKKPKPTFGDAMLGIPSQSSNRDGPRDNGNKRDNNRGGGRDRRDAAPAGPREERKAPSPGPVVVVKRAGGAVETRKLEAPAETAVAPEGTAAAPEPVAHEAAPVTPTAPNPLFEEVPENQSFAELYEAQAKVDGPRKSLKVGEKVKVKIFQLGADTAFVSVGGKSEAMIELNELKDDQGVLRYGVGDEVEAHVVEMGAKGIILSRKLSKGAATLSLLAEAKASGLPVEGLVLSVNKGGLEVAVGDLRAFCPSSQADVRFNGKLEQFIGEKLLFRVSEVKEKNVVLSRRAILEEEQKLKAAETRKLLQVGAVLKGKITSVRDFGAFADLGGLEGLIPVSELSHTHLGHPSEAVSVGDEVEVEVIRMEDAQPNSPDKAKQRDRLTLSMRSRQEDPFVALAATLTEGSKIKGKVVRLQPFGAFVELAPGVDGLIHVSAMSDRRIAHPRDVLKVGEEVEVQVEKVDPAEKRIGLRLVKDGAPVGAANAPMEERAPAGEGGKPGAERKPSAPRARLHSVVTGKVDRIEPFGIFISWEGGRGLIPAAETGTERGTDLKRVFPMGTELKAEVIELQGEKLKLSIIAAQRSEERADLEAWKKTQAPAAATGGKKGFGTFADLLKGLKT
jgi:small subunit ribosomal protein S1